jgi:hypothetical protein
MHMRIHQPGKNRCIAEIVHLRVRWHLFRIDDCTNLLTLHKYGRWVGFARRHDAPRKVCLQTQRFTPAFLKTSKPKTQAYQTLSESSQFAYTRFPAKLPRKGPDRPLGAQVAGRCGQHIE